MIADLLDNVHARALLVALTCNASCALIGCFLVLRRMSLMGDALSHAVLPGLVIAFVVSGSQGPLPMLAGALAAGLVTTFLTQTVQRYGRLAADASLGVVYTSLFALGVLLVKRFFTESKIHFDIQCVFEGDLLQVALDTFLWREAEIPYAILAAAPVLLLLVVMTQLFWKELKLSAFDPQLAASLGFAPGWMHYLLMLLVSLATVTSFEAIGSILVIAMLIAPAAAAQLLTKRLAPMMLIAVVLSSLATLAGYQAAVAWDVSPGGAVAVAAGVVYAVAAVLSPTEGMLTRVIDNVRVATRVRREDILALLYRSQEANKQVALAQARRAAGSGLLGALAMWSVQRRREATKQGETLALTAPGLNTAAELVRSHRLWESYLVDEVGIQADHVHDAAHVMEHVLDDQIREEIAQQLGGIERDPHGRQIP